MNGYHPAPVGSLIAPGDLCYNLDSKMFEPAKPSIGRKVRPENLNWVIRPDTAPDTYPSEKSPEILQGIRVRNFLSKRGEKVLTPKEADRLEAFAVQDGPVLSDRYPSLFTRYFRKAA